jgi:hypothetical protein
MSATSGVGVTAKDVQFEAHEPGAPAKHALNVKLAVCPLARLRADSASDGPEAAASCSGAPAVFSAAATQENAKPPFVLHAGTPDALTTAASATSAEREVDDPLNEGVMVTRRSHGVQLRPSPAMPTGQGPQVDAVVHCTPEKQDQVMPQPAGGGGDGGGGAGAGGCGGAEMVATTGGVVSAKPVVATPADASAVWNAPPEAVAVLMRLDVLDAADALSRNT